MSVSAGSSPTRPPARRGLLLAAAGGLVLAAAGCVPSLPGSGPGPRTFRLTPKTTFEPPVPRVTWSLAVAQPTAEQALDTLRIAVVTGGTEVDYVAGANWVDRAPAMIQSLLVQSFRGSDGIAAVGTDRDRQRPDFLLRSELRAFQLNRSGDDGAKVRVRLDPTLLRLPRREMIESESFVAEIEPEGAGLDAVVAAFDTALGRVMRDLVPWALAAGERAGPSDA